MLFALLAAVAFGGECDGQVNAKCSSCTYTANCAWMVGSETCLSIGNADVLSAYKEDNSSVKTKYSGCGSARSVESRLERLVTELAEARGVVSYENNLDFAPSAVKGRLARDMCFSDCYAMNGKVGNWDNCWQFQPCYDNCVQACLNAFSEVTYNADVAALDEHLVKTRRGVVSYENNLDFAPSALKGRIARDMCFSDCYAKNGKYDLKHCWQFQPCYDNCVTACIDADPVTFNADVAALDEHLVNYPTEFKCWVRMPTGCDRDLSETDDAFNWFVDRRSGNSATCKNRRGTFNTHCSRSDAESQFRGVKPPAGALANGGAADGPYKGRSVGAAASGGRF